MDSRGHGFQQWDTSEPLRNVLSRRQYFERLQTDIEGTGVVSKNSSFATVTFGDATLRALWCYLEEEALPELERRKERGVQSEKWVEREMAKYQSSFWLRKMRDRGEFDKVIESEGVFEKLEQELARFCDITESNIEFRLDAADLFSLSADTTVQHLSYSADKKRRRWHKDAEGMSRLLCCLYGIRTPYVCDGLPVWVPGLPEDSEKTYQHRDTYESIVVEDDIFETEPVISTYGDPPTGEPREKIQCIMNSVVQEGVRHQLLHGFVTAEEIDRTPAVTLNLKQYRRIFMMIDHVKEK